MTDERRSAIRHRTLKAGLILFNDGRSTITCLVRNLSGSGARLKVESVIGIPDSIVLAFEYGPKVPARVAWRKGTEIGITFDHPQEFALPSEGARQG